MLSSLWNLGAFIVALSILVAIHEYGHFWVARRCGVKVHRFSIGFGKVLFKKVDKHGTEFAFAAIPLGGYVKMLDGRVDTLKPEDEAFAFDKKTVWQRIAIVAAGPIANFLLAIVAFFLMFTIGVNSAKPIMSGVQEDSPMAVLQDGQKFQVMAVNGRSVEDWEALNLALVNQIGETQFVVDTQAISDDSNITTGAIKSSTVSLQGWKFNPKTESIIDSLGFVPFRPEVRLQVAQVVADGAGEKAGLQVDDKLLAVDGVLLSDWQHFVELIQKNADQTLQLEIERGTIVKQVELTPGSRQTEAGLTQGYIGVSPIVTPYPDEYRIKLQFSPLQAIEKAITKTGQLIELTFNTLIKLITGDISVKNLSGPVGIAKGAGMSADYGIEYFLGFIALVSVNLGLMNLIPLPVLDGGHLLYYSYEVITGKALSEKIQEIGFKIGGIILMSLMAVAILNDFDLL